MNRMGRGRRTRYERESQARSMRARTHHDRIQRSLGGRTPRRLSDAAHRFAIAGAFALSLLAGALLAWPIVEAAAELLTTEPSQVELIAVQGNQRLDTPQVAAATGVARGCPFRDLDLDEIAERLEAHPWIRSASATRLPPGQLLIRIEEREPAAILVDASGEAKLVDRDATPFAAAEDGRDTTLVALHGVDTFAYGEPSPRLARALELADDYERQGLLAFAGVPTLHISDESAPNQWRLDVGDPPVEVILGGDDLEGQLARLAQLLAANIEGVGGATRIDLRFLDRAVLEVASNSR